MCLTQVGLNRRFHQLTGQDTSILRPGDTTATDSADFTGCIILAKAKNKLSSVKDWVTCIQVRPLLVGVNIR
jgi:hypothetical protein